MSFNFTIIHLNSFFFSNAQHRKVVCYGFVLFFFGFLIVFCFSHEAYCHPVIVMGK